MALQFDSATPSAFLQDELNDLNSFISEFAIPSDFAENDGLFMYDTGENEDDMMKVDVRPAIYSDYVQPTTTAPAVIFPHQPAVPADLIYTASQSSRVSAAPMAELAVGALTICEEPTQFGRFRYKSEKREKSLEGDKTFPEVMVNPAILKTITQGTITVSLVTRSGQPHWHELGGSVKVNVTHRQCRYKFNNLTVLMDKAMSGDVRRNKEDQRAVRLRFDLNFFANGKTYTSTVISRAIFNAKLQINKLSTTQGPITGQTEVIVLCSKVRKATTFIKIRDMFASNSAPSPLPGSEVSAEKNVVGIWDTMSDYPSGKSFMVPSSDLQFHHQYAIIFNMPAYYRQDVTEAVHVEIMLIDLEDQTESQACEFTYYPQESSVRKDRADNKRRRLQGDADMFGPGGSGRGSNGGQSDPHQGGNAPNGGGDSSGFGIYQGGGNVPSGYMAADAIPAPILNAFCMTGDISYILRSQARALREADDDGEAPLHLAITGGQPHIASSMIDVLGHDDILNDCTNNGDCAIHLAAWTKNASLIQKLIRYGARGDLVDRQGRTPFAIATELGHLPTLEALTAHPDMFWPPLNAQLSITNDRGLAPLHIATMRNDLTFIMKLVQLGADPLQRTTTDHRTPLHLAVVQANISVAKYLLIAAQKVDANAVNMRDRFDNTPLHLAAMSEDRLGIASLLVSYKADLTFLNSEFLTPREIARSLANPGPMLAALRRSVNPSSPKTQDSALLAVPATPSHAVGHAVTAAAPVSSAGSAKLPARPSKHPLGPTTSNDPEDWVVDDFDGVPSHTVLSQRDRHILGSPFGSLAAVPAALLRSTSPGTSSSSTGSSASSKGKDVARKDSKGKDASELKESRKDSTELKHARKGSSDSKDTRKEVEKLGGKSDPTSAEVLNDITRRLARLEPKDAKELAAKLAEVQGLLPANAPHLPLHTVD